MSNKITKVVNLSERDAGVTCRIHTSLINNPYKRNHWVNITNNNCSIFRQVKGLSEKDFNQETIKVDYDSCLELGIKAGSKTNTDLIICVATGYEKLVLANLNHPDYTFRVSFCYALLGGGLGFIGLILGIL